MNKDQYIIDEKATAIQNLDTGEFVMSGEGGGKGGGGRAAREADNTLRSAAVVRVVEVLGEGPIAGLCGGAQGILINSTPLQNQDGTYNFPRVAWDYRVGLPQQDYMPGFPSASSELNVSAPVLTTTPVVRTTSEAGIDAVKVVIQLPEGLNAQNLKNGDLNGTSVSFRIDTKLTSQGNWIPYDSYTISGKTTSVYETQYRIPRPAGTGPWDVRVVRLTADSDKQSLRNKIAWARMTEIVDVKLGYEDTAVLGIAIDAESVGSTIPTRSYMVKGRIISVPVNYNPETRVYAGIWNGTFKQAWTDNPAWILYDLLTHERYGMGEFITNSDIDIYSFYDASVYNDGLVPDGKGGQEPRFTFSTLLNTQEAAGRVLQLVAGAFNASLVQINGKWTVLQDRPTSPARNITNSNVVDGEFNYRSSGLYDRHTAFNVTWNDRTDRYLLKTSVVEDTAGIARYGYVPYDLAAYGATTEGQAIRKGKWALETELNQTELVTFRMGMNGFDLINNDIVQVFDEDYTKTIGEGRILSAVGTKVVLDRAVPVRTGASLTYTLADGFTTAVSLIVNPEEVTDTLTLQTAPLQPILQDSVYIVIDRIQPRQFKILNLTYPDDGTVEVEAVFHDPNKYSRVEQGINVPAPIFSDTDRINSTVVVTPTNLIFVENAVLNPDGTITRTLLVNWTPATTGSIPVGYYIQYNRSEDTSVYDQTPVSAYTIPVTGDGVYSIYITAFDGIGRVAGSVLAGEYVVNSETLGTLSNVQNLYVKGTSSLLWNSSDLNISWEPNSANIKLTQDYEVQVRTVGGTLLYTTITTATEFTYTLNQNRADNSRNAAGPAGTLVITVTPRDLFSRKGAATVVTFTNPAPAAVTGLTVYPGYQQASIQWNNQTEPDVIGYLVWRGLTPGFTPSSANLVAEGLINNVKDAPILDSTTYYYKVAAYDIFHRDLSGASLNVTSSLGVTTTPGANVNEYRLSGSIFKPNDPEPNKVTWTGGEVYQTLGVGSGTSWSISPGGATWTEGILYIYYKAGDTFLTASSLLSDAVAANKIIVATYRGGTNLEAANGRAYMDGSLVIAGTIAAGSLAVGAVRAENIAVTQLQAISSDLGQMTGGSLTMNENSFIRGGQVDYAQGEGFFAGYSEGLYKLSMGTNDHFLRYNGYDKLEISCDLFAARGTFGGSLLAGVLNFSELEGITYQYPNPGTYYVVVPAGKTTMRIAMCGGGGGGGFGGWDNNKQNGGGGGGGSSDLVVATFNNLTPGATLEIIIGAGGVGATGTIAPDQGGHGGDGGTSSVAGYLVVEGGLGGRGGYSVNPGAGGLGKNGGGNGGAGGRAYQVASTSPVFGGITTYTWYAGARGSAGLSTNGGSNGGVGGEGAMDINPPDNPANIYASNGQGGKAIIEFFNPNSVVTKTSYDILLSALTRQGIATV